MPVVTIASRSAYKKRDDKHRRAFSLVGEIGPSDAMAEAALAARKMEVAAHG
jgi:hypothetical protein